MASSRSKDIMVVSGVPPLLHSSSPKASSAAAKYPERWIPVVAVTPGGVSRTVPPAVPSEWNSARGPSGPAAVKSTP